MKIYVAGPYSKKDEVRRVQDLLRAAGHQITFDWTACDDSNLTGFQRFAHRRQCAIDDGKGVYDAVALVVVCPHDSTAGGLDFEMGLAVAWRRILIVIGEERENETIFLSLPGVIRASVAEDLPAILEELVGCGPPEAFVYWRG